jgi:hypothetical protein
MQVNQENKSRGTESRKTCKCFIKTTALPLEQQSLVAILTPRAKLNNKTNYADLRKKKYCLD